MMKKQRIGKTARKITPSALPVDERRQQRNAEVEREMQRAQAQARQSVASLSANR